MRTFSLELLRVKGLRRVARENMYYVPGIAPPGIAPMVGRER
ncbi:MAG: hypothetical protein ACREJA_09820 [Candidatus Methylomirabilales bacterium]